MRTQWTKVRLGGGLALAGGLLAGVPGGLMSGGLMSGGLVTAVSVAGAVTLSGGTAHAQARMMRMAGGSTGMMPKINRRSIAAYERILGLSEEQKEAAMTLVEGYAEQHRSATDEFEGRMERLQEDAADGNWQVYQTELPKMAKEMSDKINGAEKQFFDEFKSLLTDTQMEQFTKVERHRRREQFMRFGLVSGAAVDVGDMAQRAGLDLSGPEVKEVVESYETDVDRHLLEVQRMQKEAEEAMGEDEGGMGNWQKQQEMMDEGAKKYMSIRDINRDYARRLSMQMSEEQKAKFEESINKRSFGRIYRDPHVVKQLEAALKFEDLKPEQKQQLQEMKDAWKRESASANKAWADAQTAAEDELGGTMQVMMQGMMRGWGGDDKESTKAEDLKKAREARRDLERKYADRMKEFLSREQRDRLPKREPEGTNPWADIFGGGEDEEDSDE